MRYVFVTRLIGVCCLSLFMLTTSHGGEIDFREDFALSQDRAAVLKQLIPGTEDYYYYHALHYLQTEQFEKVNELLPVWIKRHGETGRVWQIRMRQALLAYDTDSNKSLGYLKQRLNLYYPHQREQLDVEPNLPTALNEAEISLAKFYERALQQAPNSTDSFEDTAYDLLADKDLDPIRRRHFLGRLNRPDHPGLVKLIVADLNYQNSGGFGSLPIHRLLMLDQLEELAKLRPDVLNQQIFVVAMLRCLQPSNDVSWQQDRAVLRAYLDRLEAFAKRLEPVHNSLKAHVLYHQLQLAKLEGKYDRERFLEYLKLPKQVSYIAAKFMQVEANRRFPSDLNANYEGALLLPPVGNDEPLVRDYLRFFLVDAQNTKEFEPYVNDVYLKHLLAEVKIVNGLGEVETWAALLPPENFQQLKERVDLDFDPTNKVRFTANEAVTLNLQVKNVNTLIVKVFEINTKNFYRTTAREVDTDINLDGLVPNIEQTHKYAEPPLRRTARKFEFPQLTKPGVYVIDFIGNGRSSRALIRKGDLKHLSRTGSAGQVITILDEQNKKVTDGRVWLAGNEYTADKDGTITIPFSNSPGRQPIILTAPVAAKDKDGKRTGSDELSVLAHLEQEAENYNLNAGIYVDREALLKRATATLAIRPQLTINGNPVSLKLLEEVTLRITATDLDGIPSTQEIENFPVYEDRETTHDFQVPPRLASVLVQLTAKVPKLSAGGKKQDLGDSHAVSLNEIDKTDKTEDLFLVQADGNYIVELRGKTGEARPSRPVTITMKHRLFRHPYHTTLKTDPAGRITIGALTDIASITVSGPQGISHTWNLRRDNHTYGGALHGNVEKPLLVPYLPQRFGKELKPELAKTALSRDEVSLIELRGGAFYADRFENLKLDGGLLKLEKLAAGDYDLWLKSTNAHIRVRLTTGEVVAGYLVGNYRQLEISPLAPLQIESVTVVPGKAKPAPKDDKKADDKKDKDKKNDDKKDEGKKDDGKKDEPEDKNPEKLVIKLRNASKYSRVHIFATRMFPEYDAYGSLSEVRAPQLYARTRLTAESVYLTGRNIGDEYRYIIDRKYATKFPGNMLERPSLLLNPWAVRPTETGEQLAQGGDAFGGRGNSAKDSMGREAGGNRAPGQVSPQANFTNLDFLTLPSAVLLNLEADENGVIEIDRAALAGHQELTIVAVDPLQTTVRNFSLPESKTLLNDLRLLKNLDPTKHYAQQKQISIVKAGETFTLHDITTGKFESYDDLSRVYSLYTTLNKDPKLIEFAFILNWPKLKLEEKRTLYSKYASHELSFFLFKKDPEFYKSVIVPYLANKKDKTFIDDFLIEVDLKSYLRPWQYGQLNTVERILLAQRVKGEGPHTARAITDNYNLLPPNLENYLRLFDTAVQRGSLDTSDRLGLREATLKGLNDEKRRYAGDAKMDSLAARGGASNAPATPAAESTPAPPSPPKAAAAAEPLVMRKEMEQLQKAQESAKKSAPGKPADSRERQLTRDKNGADGPAAKQEVEFFDADGTQSNKRGLARQFYRKLDKTMEWAENNYYHLTIDQQNAALISVSAFWRDYAAHDPSKPFLSKNLAEGSRNFPEMMYSLAVLDLPFEAPKHTTKFEGTTMTLTPGGPLVVYHEEIQPTGAPDGKTKVLVSQNFFRQGDRHRMENGEQVDKFVSEEFLVHVVYGCQVVVTNPTSTRQKLNMLTQIPRGSLPVLNSQATKTTHLTLEPYHTQTFEFYFYFPYAGKFPQYPVHVAKNEAVIAAADPLEFNVVDKATKLDKQSWEYISQHGTDDDVLAFLDRENIAAVNLDRIAWRMKDAKMFAAVLAKLNQRHAYNQTLWSYSLLHNVVAAAREFLQHNDQVISEAGGRIRSTLLTIDPIERRTFEHLEYKPLVNARAHSLGKRRQIVNDRFHWQYHRYLEELCFEPQLGQEDLMAVTYYMLLQDRIEESLKTFARVTRDKVAMHMQYDYCAAYLALFSEDFTAARAVAIKYAEHPVDRWRNTFAAITAQLDEAEGKETKITDAESRDQQQAKLAATAPSLDFTVEAKQIVINSQNIAGATINFYEMDVELLFSRNPFVQQFQGEFNSIKPNHTMTVELAKVQAEHKVPLPQKLLGKNVIVEITADGITKTVPYYAHTLAVQTIENYGQVKVTHQTTGKPVAKAYVKVYAKLGNGEIKFYKDGYTDIRGRFDYASLNTNELEQAQRFSILILSDDYGALVREANPPKQ
jgi:hypothetical protein